MDFAMLCFLSFFWDTWDAVGNLRSLPDLYNLVSEWVMMLNLVPPHTRELAQMTNHASGISGWFGDDFHFPMIEMNLPRKKNSKIINH